MANDYVAMEFIFYGGEKVMRRIILFLFAVFVVTAWTLPSYAAETTFGGAWRVRFLSFDNNDDFRDDLGDASSSIDQRFRLNVTSRGSEDFGGFLQMQAGNDTWGTSTTFDVTTNQAYLDFNVQNVNVKVGRQDMDVAGDIHNLVLIQTRDAVVASTQVGPATVYGGLLKLDEVDSTTADSNDDRDAFYLGAQFMPAEGVEAGVFWVVDKDSDFTSTQSEAFAGGSDGGDTILHYLGASGEFAAGPVNLALEGVVRTGEDDTPASGTTAINYSGWAFAADAHLSPNDMFTVGLVVGIGSGDDNHTDTDAEAFVGIDPSFTHSQIYFDGGDGGYINSPNSSGVLGGTGELGGVTVVKPYVSAKINDKLTVSAQYAWLQYTEENDSRLCDDTDGSSAAAGVALGGATAACSESDDSLGSEFNLQADYMLHTASSLGLQLQANWFFPGDGILTSSQKSSGYDDVVREYIAKIQYDF